VRTYEPPTAAELAALQAVIDRSTRTATPAVAESVAYPDRQMSAAELIEFWRAARLCAMTTVGANGQPHTAPVHASITGATLHLVIYENTVRRRDLATNPRVSFTTWKDGAAAIVYGRAHEVPNSLRATRPGRSGAERNVVEIAVQLTRIYAMRPPETSDA
jgi:Pyridoxamine 5'-phosphate oxidase